MAPPSRIASALQRLIARLGAWPAARRAWRWLYGVAARLWGVVLAPGGGASLYARGGLASGDLVPGLSDIDLVLVAGSSREAERLRGRWGRLRRVRAVRELLDWPRIYDTAELARLGGTSALTYGLAEGASGEGDAGAAAYYGPEATLDAIRALERPGLDGIGSEWRLLRGPDRRPGGPGAPPGGDSETTAAWLELVYLWRWVAAVCLEPNAPRSADLAVKLVADPARIWLRLERAQRVRDRRAALEMAMRELPGERDGIEPALELAGRLDRLPSAPVAEILPGAARLSALVAESIAGRLAGAGRVTARLEGLEGRPARGIEGPPLPLVDWRAVVCPPSAAETFDVLPGGFSEARPIADAASAPPQAPGAVHVLAEHGLLVQPARSFLESRMRAIRAPFSDPVSFALLSDRSEAEFPAAPGWSVSDWARRGVREHRALLAAGGAEVPGIGPAPSRLGALLTAARAGVVLEGSEAGEPVIPVTLPALAHRLEARPGGAAAADAVDARERWVRTGEAPPAGLVAAMEDLVSSMPAYRRGR